ncbi:GNAT family N-acetyltransferase [Nocardia sp. NPDC050713]|uniref:GNAT family N-acetyltransferase n=1 Tax=Nocardia sp. NPDC050713 TaxID=3154511 RepID=UPI0033DD4F80
MAALRQWPTAFGAIDYDQLPVALEELARAHARRALACTGSREPLALIDQAVSIGACAESLLKAVLAGIDIHLVRGHMAGLETTLTLAGRPENPDRPLPDLWTLGGLEAAQVLNRVTPPDIHLPEALLTRIVTVRDSAIHMGFVNRDESERALADLVVLVDRVLAIRRVLGQDADWAAFWSPIHLERADALLRQRAEPVVELIELSEQSLPLLLDAAVTDADPLEVMAPVAGPPGWTAVRKEAFLAFHRDRALHPTCPNERTFVITVEGRVVGAARLEPHGDEVEAGVWIGRSHRGRGIGGRVATELRALATRSGARRITAVTTPDNIAARQLIDTGLGARPHVRGDEVIGTAELG